jgi:hypothetical protein
MITFFLVTSVELSLQMPVLDTLEDECRHFALTACRHFREFSKSDAAAKKSSKN